MHTHQTRTRLRSRRARIALLTLVLIIEAAVRVSLSPRAVEVLHGALSVPRATMEERMLRRRRQRLDARAGTTSLHPFFVWGTGFGGGAHPAATLATTDAGAPETFPVFRHALFPVERVPNWGAMRTPAAWDRSYGEMTAADLVPVPAYDLRTLTLPMERLLRPLTAKRIPAVTAKLFYSTRYFGAYDLDAGEFTGVHPGVDLKLALGTPVGAIGGGRVIAVEAEGGLGLHVIVEHRVDGERLFSIYGHLASAAVQAGDTVEPGSVIGTVGMTGNTTAPHLHLQVDRDRGEEIHTPYQPAWVPSPEEAARWSVHPTLFIEGHR